VNYHDCDDGERGEVVTDERGTYCHHCGHEFELRPEFQVEDVETFAAIDEPGAEPLVVSEGGAVLPVGGFALVYGDGGAGKTTLCIDWGVHFATGSTWLGMLAASSARTPRLTPSRDRALADLLALLKREGVAVSPEELRRGLVES
jgi:hypothetical protein